MPLDAPLVATASKEVRNKNLIFIALCAIFTLWFGYDGLVGYPKNNDNAVKQVKEKNEGQLKEASAEIQAIFANWPGWKSATQPQQDAASDFMREKHMPYKWHSRLDILVQLLITGGLVLVTAGSVWYFFRCQKRRATADENALSPAPGVSVPWSAITVVDNTRWKKSGIVRLTYRDASGAEKQAVLDDYHLDNLRPILQELASRADKAEFIPRPEASAADAEPSKSA